MARGTTLIGLAANWSAKPSFRILAYSLPFITEEASGKTYSIPFSPQFKGVFLKLLLPARTFCRLSGRARHHNAPAHKHPQITSPHHYY